MNQTKKLTARDRTHYQVIENGILLESKFSFQELSHAVVGSRNGEDNVVLSFAQNAFRASRHRSILKERGNTNLRIVPLKKSAEPNTELETIMNGTSELIERAIELAKGIGDAYERAYLDLDSLPTPMHEGAQGDAMREWISILEDADIEMARARSSLGDLSKILRDCAKKQESANNEH